MKLATLSYFKTGGTCETLHAPASHEQLQSIVKDLHRTATPYFVLGAGTNSLVSDEHWPGAVISLHNTTSIRNTDTIITCQAGVQNNDFVSYCLARKLHGAEWMTALPGQIGATTRMNARCYGGEISELVMRVKTVSPQGETAVHDNPRAVFRGYKDTLFMHNNALVTEVDLQLQAGKEEEIKKEMQRVKNDRVEKGQFLYPSCGCVFKNDYSVGVPSGMLLDAAEVQNFSQKKVFISPRHANFIFNTGGSSAEIITLSLKMRDAVYKKFGVWLRYEMEFLGHIPPNLHRRILQTKPHNLRHERLHKLKVELNRPL